MVSWLGEKGETFLTRMEIPKKFRRKDPASTGSSVTCGPLGDGEEKKPAVPRV